MSPATASRATDRIGRSRHPVAGGASEKGERTMSTAENFYKSGEPIADAKARTQMR